MLLTRSSHNTLYKQHILYNLLLCILVDNFFFIKYSKMIFGVDLFIATVFVASCYKSSTRCKQILNHSTIKPQEIFTF